MFAFLTEWFVAGGLLAGLIAVVIPPLIHLLSRRRYDVVDWAAMQFLKVSERTRRKLFLEELLLMLLRMLLLAVIVIALAAPFVRVRSSLAAPLGASSNRDVVLLFDGSSSMGFKPPERDSADGKAREWAREYLDRLPPGEGVGILQARRQASPVLGLISHDPDQARKALADMPPPGGAVDWAEGFRAAFKLLASSKAAVREVIVLTDNQRYGWADEGAQLRWELLASQFGGQAADLPAVRVVQFDADRSPDAVNWSLDPLKAGRAVAAVGQRITFRTSLRLRGKAEGAEPPRVTVRVYGPRPGDEGRVVDVVEPRRPPAGEASQVPVSFTVPPKREKAADVFTAPGSYLVEASIPGDALPGDDKQWFAVEVVRSLPVLLVDGDTRSAPRNRGTDFLRDALAPALEKSPTVPVRVIPASSFEASDLTRDVRPDDPGSAPRVLVLSNVAELSPAQQEAVARFAEDGGGILVALGERCKAESYNRDLFRNGTGWLPARLVDPVGNEADRAAGARLQTATLFHPALDLFRTESGRGGLADAVLPRYWRLSTKDAAASQTVAQFTNSDPFLVERPFGKGRVLACCVPLDDSWGTDLPKLLAFPALAHELTYYLAGARAADANLQPGQPAVFRATDDVPVTVTVQPPEGPARKVTAERWPLTFEETREPGRYTLTTPGGGMGYFVVQGDGRESDLAALTEEDRGSVAKWLTPGTRGAAVRLSFTEATATPAGESPVPMELWWLLLGGVVALLLSEVWMTRRMAARAG